MANEEMPLKYKGSLMQSSFDNLVIRKNNNEDEVPNERGLSAIAKKIEFKSHSKDIPLD
jgi:hypothetical protein